MIITNNQGEFMSDLMREFLETYLKWAVLNKDAAKRAVVGLEDGRTFDPWSGLCSAVWRFISKKYAHLEYENAYPIRMALRAELRAMLDASGLDRDFPFGECAYDEGYENGNLHTDPNRLAWIRSQLEATPNV